MLWQLQLLCGSVIPREDVSSLAIMEDYAKRIAAAGTQSTYPMAQVDTVGPACSLNASVTHSEDYPIALLQSDNFHAGLHARPLFRKHELPAGEILIWN